jgi:hypothetical protein
LSNLEDAIEGGDDGFIVLCDGPFGSDDSFFYFIENVSAE